MFEMITSILAFVLVLLLPGLIWTYAIWPEKNGSRDRLSFGERIIFSYLISLVTVPLLIIGFNVFFGMRISATSTFLSVGIVSALGLLGVSYNKKRNRMIGDD
ncbi:MAG: DUF1616 domain-containing protein [Methanomassiliicoccales archaeon]|jgi:uncharacterized membrane protein|nr:DUF1616 domain-containing protein [Methanomassiliicoccales archaeon]